MDKELVKTVITCERPLQLSKEHVFSVFCFISNGARKHEKDVLKLIITDLFWSRTILCEFLYDRVCKRVMYYNMM